MVMVMMMAVMNDGDEAPSNDNTDEGIMIGFFEDDHGDDAHSRRMCASARAQSASSPHSLNLWAAATTMSRLSDHRFAFFVCITSVNVVSPRIWIAWYAMIWSLTLLKRNLFINTDKNSIGLRFPAQDKKRKVKMNETTATENLNSGQSERVYIETWNI